jgi:peptidoglycan/LPS O-acetylase OafA/YrhL
MLLNFVVRWIDPELYGSVMDGLIREPGRFLISLTFINQAWGLDIVPAGDIPYWTLGYEVPYYVIFGLWYFGGLKSRLVAAAIMLALGPYIVCTSLLWIVGYGCYHLCKRASLTRGQGLSIFLASSISWIILTYLKFSIDLSSHHVTDQSVTLYVAGLPFAGTIVGFSFLKLSIADISRPVRWVSGGTFTLYLMHVPLAVLLTTVLPPMPLLLRWFIVMTVILTVSFVVARYTERRKSSWKRAISRILERLAGFQNPRASIAASAAS